MPPTVAQLRKYKDDPAAFVADLIVPSANGVARFGDVMAPFQRERFADLLPALQAVSRNEKPANGKHWWEATKGASKDSDLAAATIWLLCFATRPLQCQLGAGSLGQSEDFLKAARGILHLNPWISDRIEVQNYRVLCRETGASLEILTTDATGMLAHGARPDLLLVNELSHITREAHAHTLLDNATKMPQGVVVIATPESPK